jgi:uncharacterized protein with ParB-like and HNH nuclease domain
MASIQDIFTPASLTIKQLFNNSDSLYQIPRYQRPYKWADEQIDKLWDDLTEAYDNQTESYFLGSVITAAPKDVSSYLDVVDGQQRITTLMILFAVVRDLFPALNRNPANPDPANITSKTIKSSILADDEYNRLKLYTHSNHQTDFENLIINADTKQIVKPKKREIESDEEPRFKFLNTAAMFHEKLAKMGEEYVGKFMNYLFNNVRLIRIDCTSKEFAIKLFQVLNDRGLDLTNADLIKSYLIQKIEEEYKADDSLRAMKGNQFMQEWRYTEQIIKKFDDSLNDVLILYEYHLLGSNPKKSLYDELVAQFKFKNSLDIIKDFKKFVENYDRHLWEVDNTDVFALWYLRWNFYWKSILLTAHHTNYQDIPKLTTALKRFYYLYWIAGKTLTAIKQTSFNLIGQVKEHKPIADIEAMLQKKIEDDKIIPMAIQALNNNLYSEPWCKPLFCLLEYNATDTSKLTWMPLSKELHLEHIIPAKRKNYKEWNHITDEMFDEWGNSGANLTLLGGSKNIEASENPFRKKINVYKGKGLYENKNTKVTGYNITQKIVADFDNKKYNEEWNESAIQDRWQWFCKEVAEVLNIDKSLLVTAKQKQNEFVTPKAANEKDEMNEEVDGDYARKTRPRFNFNEMNIPVGSELLSLANGEVIVVASDRTVHFRGEETSLTNATKIILDTGYHVAPGPYWTYNGKKLRDIYNETYPMQ